MKDFNIRFAIKKDIPQIVQLCSLHAIYEKSTYDFHQKEALLNSALFSENSSLFCLVVEKDQQLIGYATYMKQFSTWDANFYIYMDCLFLTEDARGFGIGEIVVHKIKEEGKKLNCNLIQWQTPNFNIRAIKFYKRIGAHSKNKERFFLNI